MPFNGVPFVVVDTETTGGRAASDRLIEIAAVRLEHGQIVDRFQQLVNPECTVPRRISWLTGITTSMVFNQPRAADVLPDFLSFLGGGVFVAHNLSFDLRFVNEEHARAGLPPLRNETLCTLRLARRLLPGLRSKGLASLVDFYGIRMKRHHRALDDAEATAQVLIRFLDQLELEYGTETVDDVLVFQHRRYGDLRRLSKSISHLRENVLGALPQNPGVYFMKDGKGKTIYIGKAQNLSNRVRSYFNAVEGHPARIRTMVKSVRDIEWQETDSELEAMLLESQLIKEIQPPYNRAQLEYVNRPFIRLDTTHEYPRVSFSAFLHHDGAEYYGPMASRNEAAFVVEVIDRFFQMRECDDQTFSRGQKCVYASMGRCTAPCVETADASLYSSEVGRVRDFLNGTDDSVCERIEAEMMDSSAALEFEKAATYRDWLKVLRRMLDKRQGIAVRVLDHNAVVVHRPSKDGPVRLLAVFRGRHVETLHVLPPLSGSDRADIRKMLGRCFIDAPVEIESYREKEVDEVYLLTHWLYVHRNDVRQVRWEPGISVVEMTDRVANVIGGGEGEGEGEVEEQGRTIAPSLLVSSMSPSPHTATAPMMVYSSSSSSSSPSAHP